jgi:hypothetical protein
VDKNDLRERLHSLIRREVDRVYISHASQNIAKVLSVWQNVRNFGDMQAIRGFHSACIVGLTENVVYKLIAIPHEKLETGKYRVCVIETILEVDAGGLTDEAKCRGVC